MPMQFNPHTAFLRGMDLGSPSTSQGGINSLLQMQQNTLNGLTDTIGNIGKTSRTNTVNDLIARGGLEGLNEAQTQAKIAQTAGGTLTPEGQMQVDKLLQLTGKQDERNFTKEQQNALFRHQTDERLGRQTFDDSQRSLGEKFQGTQKEADRSLDKLLKEKQIASSEKMNSQQIRATLRGQYKQEAGADGYYYNIYPDGSSVRTSVKVNDKDAGVGGSGGGREKNNPLELTGRALKFHDELTGKGKNAFKQIYETGDLQVTPAQLIKQEDGSYKEDGYKVMYLGKPITINELKKMVERKK